MPNVQSKPVVRRRVFIDDADADDAVSRPPAKKTRISADDVKRTLDSMKRPRANKSRKKDTEAIVISDDERTEPPKVQSSSRLPGPDHSAKVEFENIKQEYEALKSSHHNVTGNGIAVENESQDTPFQTKQPPVLSPPVSEEEDEDMPLRGFGSRAMPQAVTFDNRASSLEQSFTGNTDVAAEQASVLRAVICISRDSSTKSKPTVKKRHEANETVYRKFQELVHPKLHACASGDCPAEHISIVFNGFSSNTDMARNKGKPFKDLRQRMFELMDEADPHAMTAIIFRNEDGLFTNAPSVRAFFLPMIQGNFTFYMWKNTTCFTRYALKDLLTAIDEAEQKIFRSTPSARLVLDWTRVAVNKHSIGVAQRDNRGIFDWNFRNVIDANATPDKPVIVMEYSRTEEESRSSGKPLARHATDLLDGRHKANTAEAESVNAVEMTAKANQLNKYELVSTADGQLKCVLPECSRVFASFGDLHRHLVEDSRKAGYCLLCPSDKLRVFPQKHSDYSVQRRHVFRHLPPTFVCERDGCDFTATTKGNMNMHMRDFHKHEAELTVECRDPICDEKFATAPLMEFHYTRVHAEDNADGGCTCKHCGKSFAHRTNVMRHRVSNCAELKNERTVRHACPDCGALFGSQAAMRDHTHAEHRLGPQVVGFALATGTLHEDDIPVGATEKMKLM